MIERAQALIVGALVSIVLAGLSAAGAGLWAWHKRGQLADADKAAAISTMQTQHERDLGKANQRIAELEAADAKRVKEAQDAQIRNQADIDRMARELARMRLQRDGLLDTIAAYAAGRAEGEADTLAACNTRAQALGGLLGEALRASEEGAADGERCNNDLRTVLNAWPRGASVSAAAVGPAAE